MVAGPFNLRVYALIIRDGSILLSSETNGVHAFTKFPGGGLEPGEGLRDALNREMKEELGLLVSECSLYYVNDFYQPSAFNPAQQIISFYYLVSLSGVPTPEMITEERWNQTYTVRFHWEKISALQPEHLTFPVDREVLTKLQQDQRST